MTVDSTLRPPPRPASPPPLRPSAPARPATPAPTSEGPGADAADAGALFDFGLLRDVSTYVLGAVRHRRAAALGTFAVVFATAALAFSVVPRTYVSEARLLAQRNLVMPALNNPRRNMAAEEDTPTRLASEAIMNHTNLVAIVSAAGLVAHHRAHMSLPARVRHQLVTWVSGPPTDAEITDLLVKTLQSKMWVKVNEGTVTIGAAWSDPNVAHRITRTAQENFFEERHAEELALISESIAILEQHASEVNTEIRATLDTMARVRGAVAPGDRPSSLAVIRRAAPSGRVLALQSRLETLRRTITDLEQFRSRRLAELQATLADQRSTFGQAHPQISNTEELIRGLSGDSPQLAQLRREEQDLLGQLAGLGAGPAGLASASGTDPLLATAALRSLEGLQRDSVLNERLQYARSRLKISVATYEDVLSRLDAARIELQTARAAFKYKYGVIMPAEVARQASWPRPVPMLGAGLVLAVFLGVFVAVVLDVTDGRVLHRWQVERGLGLPVLGEVSAA